MFSNFEALAFLLVMHCWQLRGCKWFCKLPFMIEDQMLLSWKITWYLKIGAKMWRKHFIFCLLYIVNCKLSGRHVLPCFTARGSAQLWNTVEKWATRLKYEMQGMSQWSTWYKGCHDEVHDARDVTMMYMMHGMSRWSTWCKGCHDEVQDARDVTRLQISICLFSC